jgi:hypothetical protein
VTSYQIPPVSLSGFSSPGMPADVKVPAHNEYVLDLVALLGLVAQPDAFFAANPLFHNLRDWVTGSLNNLARAGIIKGDVDPKRSGCASCSRKKLLAFALQLGQKMQQVILQAEQRQEIWRQLGEQLYRYVMSNPHRWYDEQVRIVMYARLQTGLVRRIELHVERPCVAGPADQPATCAARDGAGCGPDVAPVRD